MKRLKSRTIEMLILPLVFASTSAIADNHGQKYDEKFHDKCGISMNLDRGMMNQLDLTDEQKAKLKSIREAHKQEKEQTYVNQKAEQKDRHQRMQSIVLESEFNHAKANGFAQEVAAIQAERRVQMMKNKHEMLSVLTTEQKTKFVQLQDDRQKECRNKRHQRNDSNMAE
ncbi:Spy/CpxP family protein refolding chaperone [Vibrio sp. PNB23_22_7]